MQFFSTLKSVLHRNKTSAPPSAPDGSSEDALDPKEFIERCERETIFEKRFIAHLCELENAIISGYLQHTELTDMQVDEVLEAVLDALAAQALARPARQFNLTDAQRDVYEFVWESCTMLRDASRVEYARKRLINPFPFRSLSHDELVQCIKTIRKSLRLWNKHGGAREYLDGLEKRLYRMHTYLNKQQT